MYFLVFSCLGTPKLLRIVHFPYSSKRQKACPYGSYFVRHLRRDGFGRCSSRLLLFLAGSGRGYMRCVTDFGAYKLKRVDRNWWYSTIKWEVCESYRAIRGFCREAGFGQVRRILDVRQDEDQSYCDTFGHLGRRWYSCFKVSPV